MVVLTADERGVHINFRPHWFQKLMLWDRETSRGHESGDFWYSEWRGITVARREREGDAIFLVNREGDRVRFTGDVPREMQAFTQELLHRRVPVEWVKTVFWDGYRSRRRWRDRT